MKKAQRQRIFASLVSACVMTGVAYSGILYQLDNTASDALYQQPAAVDGEIVVIGIDQRALDALGPLPWPRSIMAGAIDALNENPEEKPAVIGVDVLYVGEADETSDKLLVEAAEKGGNVVSAEAATFGASLRADGDDGFYMDTIAVQAYDTVFPALKAVTRQGHINAMLDADGVIRHALLELTPPEEETPVSSFSRRIYELYCQTQGLQPNPAPETDKRGFFYLPYTAQPGAYYDGYSVLDLLEGSVPEDYFSGKIVLIGPYAAGLQDSYVTAIDHSKPMYGIEIQANAIDAFRGGQFPKMLPEGAQLLLLFLLTGLCAFLLWDRKVIWSALIWLAFAGGWLCLSILGRQQGFLLHALWLPVSVTAVFLVSVAVNYTRAVMEKLRVTNTFKRYVDPSVIQELMREDADSLGLGGKMREIAVLFVDIRGFTAMSETLAPEQVVSVLNRYLSLTTACVIRNHGMLDKFVGDCTMALWNAPLKQEDYVMNACKTALEILDGLNGLQEEMNEQFGFTLRVGIGVHCGPAVVGNIGTEMHMDFTAIGDTVNTASRLESNAPSNTIYISRAVADALDGRIEATSLGNSIKLKGKADGFEVLKLEGLSHPGPIKTGGSNG